MERARIHDLEDLGLNSIVGDCKISVSRQSHSRSTRKSNPFICRLAKMRYSSYTAETTDTSPGSLVPCQRTMEQKQRALEMENIEPKNCHGCC